MPTTYPSMRRPYVDPNLGLNAARLTDDNQNACLQDLSGEQGAGSPWAPDSIRVCYSKGSGAKTQGIYVMDIFTGIETFLVGVSYFLAYPVWSRDGSDEIYFMEQSGSNVRVKAVHAVTGAVRTIFSVASNGERQKLGITAGGTYVTAHIKPSGGGSHRTIIARVDGSGILANWNINGPSSGDGSLPHPTDDDLIIASRGTGGESGEMWRISTATKVHERNFRLSHACVWGGAGGNFIYQIDSGNVVDLDDPDSPEGVVVDDGGQGAVHPRAFPCDFHLGMACRLIYDEAPFFYNPATQPRLIIATPEQCNNHGTNHWRAEGQVVGYHWSDSDSNGAHPHPSPSPDGKKILFVTDMKWRAGGEALWATGDLGDPNTAISLFVLFLDEDEEPPDPPDAVEETTTALISSPNPVEAGDTVQFTATVTPAAGPDPEGTVNFFVDDVLAATIVLVSGTAIWVTHTLTPGTRQVKAIYNGSVAHYGSESVPLTQTVTGLPPSTAVFKRS